MAQKEYIHIWGCIWHPRFKPATTLFAVPDISPRFVHTLQQ